MYNPKPKPGPVVHVLSTETSLFAARRCIAIVGCYLVSLVYVGHEAMQELIKDIYASATLLPECLTANSSLI